MFQPFTGEGARLHALLPGGLFLRPAAFQLPEFFFRRGCGYGCRFGLCSPGRLFCGRCGNSIPFAGYGLAADRLHDVEQGKLRGRLLLLPLGLPPGAERLPFLLREAEKVVQGHQRLLRDGFLRFRADNGRFFHNRLRRFRRDTLLFRLG